MKTESGRSFHHSKVSFRKINTPSSAVCKNRRENKVYTNLFIPLLYNYNLTSINYGIKCVNVCCIFIF